MKKILILLGVSIIICACHKHVVWAEYQPIPLSGWQADSLLQFTYQIQDTTRDYSLILHVRHTQHYPYQNMWLFVTGPGQDTIEFYLADQRGNWLGNGGNGLYDMPILLEQQYHYDSIGIYTLTVQQGMRDSTLCGVSDIGLEIMCYGEE